MTRLYKRCVICALAILFLLCSVLSIGAEMVETDMRAMRDGILQFQLRESGAEKVQDWIDGALSENAGIGAEWYLLALSQSGEGYDFSAYERSLLQYLSENTVTSASTRQKYALALAAEGSTDAYILQTLSDSIGKQGVMSLVFGLHLLSNGYTSPTHNKEAVVDQILSLQRADGGWGVTAGASDVDVTALTLQALALYRGNDRVEAAIGRALELISSRQTESGGFVSYGVENAESASQVITALALLDIDPLTDARFIKGDRTVLDALAAYRLPSGDFCHVIGEGHSASATEQVFFALSACLRAEAGKASIFLFELADPRLPTTDSSTEAPKDDASVGDVSGHRGSANVRVWITLGLLVLGGVLCAALALLKKRHISYYVAILLVTGILIGAVWCVDIRSARDYYNGKPIVKEATVGSVGFTVRCDAVAGEADEGYIPKNGIILSNIEIPLAQGETPLDLLYQAAQSYGFHVDESGGYVRGICYLYEFDFGELSGWTYLVNGERPSVGCGEYRLRDGDRVEFVYTRTLGSDLA